MKSSSQIDKKPNFISRLFKEELGLYAKISLGIFLFILFFEPFTLERFDFNNRLVFIAGLAGIVLVLVVLIRILKLTLIRDYHDGKPEALVLKYLEGFAILALSSVAFAFYLKFVGRMGITFIVMFKVVMICLVAPILLAIHRSYKNLKLRNTVLTSENKKISNKLDKFEKDYTNKIVEFTSENSNESLPLLIANVAFIKSADNYVEIAYLEEDTLRKKLIRNTLKNIEFQLKSYSNFIRCHRICIVNSYFVDSLHKNGSHWLDIKGSEEKIPVSRQYLVKLKEIL